MSLSDENSGVMDRFGESGFEDLGLQPSLEEVLHLEGEDVIQSHPLLVQHTDSDQSSDQSVSLEQSLRVLLLQFKQFSGGSSDLGEDERDSPDFPLVSESKLSRELQFGVESSGCRPKASVPLSSARRACAPSNGRRGTL